MKKIFDEHKRRCWRRCLQQLTSLRLSRCDEAGGGSDCFLQKASTLAANAKEKHFFDCLIKDEEEHFHIFQKYYSFLENRGKLVHVAGGQGMLRE